MTVSHIKTEIFTVPKIVTVKQDVPITQNINLETDAVHFSYRDKQKEYKPLLKVTSSGTFYKHDDDKKSIGRIFQVTISGRTMLAYEVAGGKEVIGTPVCVDTDMEAYLTAERYIVQKLIDNGTLKLDI